MILRRATVGAGCYRPAMALVSAATTISANGSRSAFGGVTMLSSVVPSTRPDASGVAAIVMSSDASRIHRQASAGGSADPVSALVPIRRRPGRALIIERLAGEGFLYARSFDDTGREVGGLRRQGHPSG